MDGPAVVPGIAKLFAGNVCFNNVAGFEQLNLASVTNVGAAKHINVSKLYNKNPVGGCTYGFVADYTVWRGPNAGIDVLPRSHNGI